MTPDTKIQDLVKALKTHKTHKAHKEIDAFLNAPITAKVKGTKVKVTNEEYYTRYLPSDAVD